jgi:GT2 family glycosyltransferase
MLDPAPLPAGSEAPKLSVLVCTHKRPDGLARLLASLVPQVEGRNRELVVVNDGTHDAIYAEVIARYGATVRYEALPASLGIAGARSRSAEMARGQFLVFTDDDCEAPPHWLDWLEATLIAHPELDVLAGITRPLDLEEANFVGRVQAHYSLLPRPHWLGGVDYCFVTACLAVRGSTFEAVGGFNSGKAFAIAGEDTELSLRLIRSGARTRIDPDWHVYHALGTKLRSEMRRFRRYGHANVQISKGADSPAGYESLKTMRSPDVLRKFAEHFRNSRIRAREFAGGAVSRLGSRIVVSLIQASYDRGAADGARGDETPV